MDTPVKSSIATIKAIEGGWANATAPPATRTATAALSLLAIIGVILVLWATSQYGLGLSPDSIAYISAGQSLASGHGLLMYDGSPYYYWPPFLPIIFAGTSLIGLPPMVAMRWLHALLFGLAIFATGRILMDCCRVKTLALIGAGVVLMSTVMMGQALFLLSDFLFAVELLGLIGTLCLYKRSGRIGHLIAAAGIASAACLTRYIGIPMVMIFILWIIITGREHRLSRATIFAAIALTPIGLWTVRNALLIGSAGGIRGSAPIDLITSTMMAASTVSRWFLPPLPGTIEMIAVGLMLAVPLSMFDRKATLPRLCLAAIAAYLILVVGVAATTAIDVPDSRILVPIFAPLVIVLIAGLNAGIDLIDDQRSRYAAEWLFVIISIGWFGLSIPSVANKLKAAHNDGVGIFGGKTWRQSATISYLAKTKLTGPIYSNAPEALYYYGGMAAFKGPQKHLYNSPTSGGDNLREFTRAISENEKIYYVWFPSIHREYLYSTDELRQGFHLRTVAAFDDGAIFQFEQ